MIFRAENYCFTNAQGAYDDFWTEHGSGCAPQQCYIDIEAESLVDYIDTEAESLGDYTDIDMRPRAYI